MTLRFDGKVAIVTGAGNGLGKAYALELARRGAKVVVNDLGGGLKGEALEGGVQHPADAVVAEIKAAGGEAVPNKDSVENGESIVKTAVDAFGKVDIVINNAGILRDTSFKRMQKADWDIIMNIHVNAVFGICKAAWPIMSEQKYGRIINVASPAGLYGNVGQANYSLAKMGMVGFTQTLAKEGIRNGIHSNIIAPLAGTRMLATVMPPDLVEALKVEHIVSLVLYLCHEDTKETGSIFECGGGTYQKVQLARAPGYWHDLKKGDPSVEDVAANWATITDMSNAEITREGSQASIANVMKLQEKSKL